MGGPSKTQGKCEFFQDPDTSEYGLSESLIPHEKLTHLEVTWGNRNNLGLDETQSELLLFTSACQGIWCTKGLIFLGFETRTNR